MPPRGHPDLILLCPRRLHGSPVPLTSSMPRKAAGAWLPSCFQAKGKFLSGLRSPRGLGSAAEGGSCWGCAGPCARGRFAPSSPRQRWGDAGASRSRFPGHLGVGSSSSSVGGHGDTHSSPAPPRPCWELGWMWPSPGSLCGRPMQGKVPQETTCAWDAAEPRDLWVLRGKSKQRQRHRSGQDEQQPHRCILAQPAAHTASRDRYFTHQKRSL